MQVAAASRTRPSAPQPRQDWWWHRGGADWTAVGKLRDRALDEVSGIVASRDRAGAFWVHNDSGDGPVLYAIDEAGQLLQTVDVRGAAAIDWEDIAIGPGRYGAGSAIYVADTGDNRFRRPVVQLYRIGEPAAEARTVDADRIDVRYPDGAPRNVETLLADPLTGDLVLVTKTRGVAELFRAPRAVLDAGGGLLQAAGFVDLGGELATGGDVDVDGGRVIVRTYERVHSWTRRPGESLTQTLARPSDRIVAAPESEAICFGPAGTGWYSVDEGAGAPIMRADDAWSTTSGS